MPPKRKNTEDHEQKPKKEKKEEKEEKEEEEKEAKTDGKLELDVSSLSSHFDVEKKLEEWKQSHKNLEERKFFEEYFISLSELLLNQVVLFVSKKPYRFTEIEFYYQGPGHPDYFTHCDEQQKQRGKWYVHRTGKSYREGTYKGIDIAFGSPDAFGGILIRGIESLTNKTELFEGPCVCVDHIIKQNKLAKASELATLLSATDFSVYKSAPLFICSREEAKKVFKQSGSIRLDKKDIFDVMDNRQVYFSGRVGLTLKKSSGGHAKNPHLSADNSTQSSWLFQPYRAMTNVEKKKKGKHYIVLELLLKGKKVEEIVEEVKVTKNKVTEMKERFEKGKGREISEFVGKDLKEEDICELYGAIKGKGT